MSATMDTSGGNPALQVISLTETNSFFDHLYSVRDRVELQLNPQTLTLQYMVRNLREGGYRRRDTTTVDPEAGLIHAKRGTVEADGPVYDPVGAIYYMRTLPLTVGDEVHLTIFDGRHLRLIAVRVVGVERIQVPAGEFECLVLKPAPLDQRKLTGADGLLHLWLTMDASRIPVRVEQKTGFGTMVLKLQEVR